MSRQGWTGEGPGDGTREEGRRLWFGSQEIRLRLKSISLGDVEGDKAGQRRQFPFKMQRGSYFVII